MTITNWYATHFESQLHGRYITLNDILPLLDLYDETFEISILGESVLHRDIPLIKIGVGSKKVLAWSQMHGNESTTTKAIFDFLKFLGQEFYFKKEIERFLATYSVYIIPMLNPDGAAAYTRENANSIDLNRDAKSLTQPESQILQSIFEKIKPDLCLNLHDQRSIYGLKNGLPATVSFLAPAADLARTITASRKIAMEHIVRMNTKLQKWLPGQIGRYDDTYNGNCVGDCFQKKGVPTILFEAGHYKDDYQREKTREYIFYALIELFLLEANVNLNAQVNYQDYFEIPENMINYKDIILRNVLCNEQSRHSSIAIQYTEQLEDGQIEFIAVVDALDDLENFKGHIDIDGRGATVLINSHKNVALGANVTSIVDQNDASVVFFTKI